jgi:hypothetical protein
MAAAGPLRCVGSLCESSGLIDALVKPGQHRQEPVPCEGA